jgi:periplasmic protein TonB
MKKILFFAIFMFSLQNIFSQTLDEPDPTSGESPTPKVIDHPIDNNSIYNYAGIEVKPEFPGGITEFQKFISRNFIIPKDFQGKGTIYTGFVIEKDGTITDIKILRDLGFGTGAETIRVLKLAPKWKPGIQNSKNVRVYFTLPISLSTP